MLKIRKNTGIGEVYAKYSCGYRAFLAGNAAHRKSRVIPQRKLSFSLCESYHSPSAKPTVIPERFYRGSSEDRIFN